MHSSATFSGVREEKPAPTQAVVVLQISIQLGSVPNDPIESPIPSRLPWQHNRIQSIGSDSIAIVDCNLPIATLTGVEDRGGGAASLCQDASIGGAEGREDSKFVSLRAHFCDKMICFKMAF